MIPLHSAHWTVSLVTPQRADTAAAVGSLVVGLLGAAYSWLTRDQSMVTTIPAILVLLPVRLVHFPYGAAPHLVLY